MINIENLPVFADDFGAYGSPTSDSTIAMIIEKSKDILTVLISFNGMEGLEKSIDIAKKYLTKYAGAEDIRSIIAKSFNDFRRNGLENPNSIFYMGVDDSPKPMYKDVADIIHKSGGLVFLAHPFEYRFEDTIGFINELRKEIKLDGIECFHPSAEIDNRIDILIDYARKNNLYISGGSDFHGDKKPNNEIGKGSGSLNISKEYIEEWVE